MANPPSLATSPGWVMNSQKATGMLYPTGVPQGPV